MRRVVSAKSTVAGFATLAVLMTAGAAQSLAGSDTVFSDDIVDGTIVHADVKPNSLGGSRFMDNSVTGGKVLDGSITGADINEATLSGGRMPFTKVESFDNCTATSPAETQCAELTFTMPAGGGVVSHVEPGFTHTTSSGALASYGISLDDMPPVWFFVRDWPTQEWVPEGSHTLRLHLRAQCDFDCNATPTATAEGWFRILVVPAPPR